MDDFIFDEEETQVESSLDIKRYWQAIVHKWWLWSIITTILAIIWVLYVKREKPVYEATAVIQFSNFEGIDWGLVDSRIQKLTSRTFAEEVVEELGLVLEMLPVDKDSIPNRRDVFSSFSTLKHPKPGKYTIRFFPNDVFEVRRLVEEDGDKIETKVYSGLISEAQADTVFVNGVLFQLADNPALIPGEAEFKIKGFRGTVKSFQSRIEVTYGRPGSIMRIKLKDSDRFLAAQMTNRLAELFVRESAYLKDEMSRGHAELLKAQVDKAERDLEASNRELRTFRKQNPIDLDATVQRNNSELLAQQNKKEEKQDQKKTIGVWLQQAMQYSTQASSLAQPELTPAQQSFFSEFVQLDAFKNNAKMIVARTRLDELSQQYEEVARSSRKSPKALELAGKIIELHKEAFRIAQEEMGNIDRDIREIDRKIARLNTRLSQLPSKQIEYTELLRKNKNLAEMYQRYFDRYQQAQLSTVAKTEEIEILDPAIVPEYPVNRNKKMKAVGGAFGALFLGIFVVLVLEFLNKSIKTPDDVKKYLKLNVLGAIPEVEFGNVYEFQDNEKIKLIDQQLVTHDYSPTPIGEAYRSLRTSIMFSKEVGRIHTLLITSMAPGDGKSFTSANLAITMAQQKSNTLLVDTDLRRGVLHNTFGLPKEPGFSNYLTNDLPISEVINPTHIPNLSVISCGSLIPNPSEMLGSHRIRRFFDEVRRRFDLIIFDTPPLTAATDAVVLSTQVNATLVVIRAGKTHRDIAKKKMELFKHVDAKIIGVVLNGTATEIAHEGYSYYHY